MTELEKFKMCMAEAGFPQPRAYETRCAVGDYALPDGDFGDEQFLRAVWRASILSGDQFLVRWCADHYVAAMIDYPYDGIPPQCPCHD